MRRSAARTCGGPSAQGAPHACDPGHRVRGARLAGEQLRHVQVREHEQEQAIGQERRVVLPFLLRLQGRLHRRRRCRGPRAPPAQAAHQRAPAQHPHVPGVPAHRYQPAGGDDCGARPATTSHVPTRRPLPQPPATACRARGPRGDAAGDIVPRQQTVDARRPAARAREVAADAAARCCRRADAGAAPGAARSLWSGCAGRSRPPRTRRRARGRRAAARGVLRGASKRRHAHASRPTHSWRCVRAAAVVRSAESSDPLPA